MGDHKGQKQKMEKKKKKERKGGIKAGGEAKPSWRQRRTMTEKKLAVINCKREKK